MKEPENIFNVFFVSVGPNLGRPISPSDRIVKDFNTLVKNNGSMILGIVCVRVMC